MSSLRVDTTGSLESSLEREWLDANGLGGWASSTVVGCNTRRYHGLLVAALRPPVERIVFWSHSDEEVRWSGGTFPLSTNQYAGAVYPRGYEHQTSFELLPLPTFTYTAGPVMVEKRVWMDWERDTTCVTYENRGSVPITLSVRPLLAFRDYHSLPHANEAANLQVDLQPGRISLQPYAALPRLFFHHNAGNVEPTPLWYYRFLYLREQERGLDTEEDLFAAVTLEWELQPGERARLGATLRDSPLDVDACEIRELQRRQLPQISQDERVNLLGWTARSFVVQREPAGKTVVAGYHWFTDWGRDTMIALPGLCMQEGDGQDARAILLEFAAYLDGGMIPNRFPDAGSAPEYNTVDAPLWFIHAVRTYVQRFGDPETLRETLFPAVQAIIEGYQAGTRYGIRVDADGLVTAGETGVQLTWMDAKVGDYVVTPRSGKPVEINALWYHGLRCAAELAETLGLDDAYSAEAERARESFNASFWNEAAGCLYDVVMPEGPDAKVRPNQVFAVSLRPELLPEERAASVVAALERELLTPYGLRSLSPNDPAYCATYGGDVWHRDTAYHQGTVWAWLIGPYVDALVNVRGLSEETRGAARQLLEPLLEHLKDAGLGSISEVFDAEPPYRPGGCVSQAWSVAEVLRVYRQYLLNEA